MVNYWGLDYARVFSQHKPGEENRVGLIEKGQHSICQETANRGFEIMWELHDALSHAALLRSCGVLNLTPPSIFQSILHDGE